MFRRKTVEEKILRREHKDMGKRNELLSSLIKQKQQQPKGERKEQIAKEKRMLNETRGYYPAFPRGVSNAPKGFWEVRKRLEREAMTLEEIKGNLISKGAAKDSVEANVIIKMLMKKTKFIRTPISDDVAKLEVVSKDAQGRPMYRWVSRGPV